MKEMQVALIRGINVGKARRVAMADLRTLIEELGFTNVRSLLNSGNVIFETSDPGTFGSAELIENTIYAKLGISAKVLVMSAEEIAEIVDHNPLSEVADNPSRLLVAFLGSQEDVLKLKPLESQNWAPEALALGRRVAYLWCPGGVLASKVVKAVDRVVGDTATTRNWGTVMKIYTSHGIENK